MEGFVIMPREYKKTVFVLWLLAGALALVLPAVGCGKKSSSDKESRSGAAKTGGTASGSGSKSAARVGGSPSDSKRQGSVNWKPVRLISQMANWKPGRHMIYVIYGKPKHKGGKPVEAGFTFGKYVGTKGTVGGSAGSGLQHEFLFKIDLDMVKLGSTFTGRVRAMTHLVTDDRAVPIRYWGKTSLGMTFEMTFHGKKVSVKGGSANVDLPWAGGLPLLANNHVFLVELLLDMMAPKAGQTIAMSFYSPKAGIAIPYHVQVGPKEKDGSLVLKDSLGETIRWKTGRILSVSTGGGMVTFVSEDRPEPTLNLASAGAPPYKHPSKATWNDVDVTVPGRDVSISGSLRIPKAKGRHPAVLFISGSGSEDRNGFAAGLDIGTWQILDWLAAHGFVVLSTDDRGTGKTSMGKNPAKLGYWDLVADADAALTFLEKRPEVLAGKVFIIGHSEGGITAVILAAKHPKKVAGIVLMAGPARNLVDVMREQMENLVLKNAPPAQAKKTRAQFEATVAAIKAGKVPDEKLVSKTKWKMGHLSRKWLSDHIQLNIATYVRKVHCPVAIFDGGKDVQVSPTKDAKKMAAMLKQAGNKDVFLKIFPMLDHLFKVEPHHSSMASYADWHRKVDLTFIKTMGHWLERHTGLPMK